MTKSMNTTMSQATRAPHEVATTSFEGTEANTLTFPEGVKMIAAAGFKGYLVDYCAGTVVGPGLHVPGLLPQGH